MNHDRRRDDDDDNLTHEKESDWSANNAPTAACTLNPSKKLTYLPYLH